jgi:hypothetical protein
VQQAAGNLCGVEWQTTSFRIEEDISCILWSKEERNYEN